MKESQELLWRIDLPRKHRISAVITITDQFGTHHGAPLFAATVRDANDHEGRDVCEVKVGEHCGRAIEGRQGVRISRLSEQLHLCVELIRGVRVGDRVNVDRELVILLKSNSVAETNARECANGIIEHSIGFRTRFRLRYVAGDRPFQ